MPDQRGRNGKPLCQPSQPPHEYRPGIRPKDATDKEAHTPRARGRSVVVLYNKIRTHRSLDKDAPIWRPVQRTGVIISNPILGGLHHHYNPDRSFFGLPFLVFYLYIVQFANTRDAAPCQRRVPISWAQLA